MMQCADSSSNERPRIAIDRNKKSVGFRQWPEVYDLCHTFLHVARDAASQKTHGHARIARETCYKI